VLFILVPLIPSSVERGVRLMGSGKEQINLLSTPTLLNLIVDIKSAGC
jgi:hypothetical protein